MKREDRDGGEQPSSTAAARAEPRCAPEQKDKTEGSEHEAVWGETQGPRTQRRALGFTGKQTMSRKHVRHLSTAAVCREGGAVSYGQEQVTRVPTQGTRLHLRIF